MAELTKWEKFTNSFLAILKLLGTIIILVISGKLLYDFMGSRNRIQTNLTELKNISWKRSSDDPEKNLIDNPLTEDEIEKELKKLRE